MRTAYGQNKRADTRLTKHRSSLAFLFGLIAFINLLSHSKLNIAALVCFYAVRV